MNDSNNIPLTGLALAMNYPGELVESREHFFMFHDIEPESIDWEKELRAMPPIDGVDTSSIKGEIGYFHSVRFVTE